MKHGLIVFLLAILFSCSKNEIKPTGRTGQLFTNTDMETGTNFPSGWWENSNGTAAQFSWANQIGFSGIRSIEISSSSPLSNVAYWGQSVTQDIPYGRNLTLQVRIKGVGISGNVAVAIACLNATSNTLARQFATTEGTHTISGDFDWTSYTVELPGVHNDITELRVYLMLLDGSTGQVYFDDVTLTSR